MSDLRLSRERLDEGRDYDPYRLSSPLSPGLVTKNV